MATRPLGPSSDSKQQKRVLVLAYFFPPIGGIGVQRTLRYVKYLPEFGWQPYVVSATQSTGPEEFDETLLQEVDPAVPAWRVSPYPSITLGKWASRVLDYIDRGSSEQARCKKAWSRARAIVRFPFVLYASPPRSYWAAISIWRAVQVIRQHRVDLVYSTAPPWPVHLAGLALKALTSRPLVVDCRDPWTRYATYRATGLRKRIEKYLERLILHKADLIVCNHQPMREAFIRMVAPCDPQKFIVITNGYDADKFHSLPPIERKTSPSAGVTIAHVGTVVPRAALPLLEAMDLLYREDRDSFERLKARFVGGLVEPERSYLAQRAWSDKVEVIGHQPHRLAIAHMAQADVLLLIKSDDEAWRKSYPGKLFEYLRVGRPILAIMLSGIATDLVAEAGVGVSFEPSQVRSIADQLRWFASDLAGFKNVHFKPRPEIVAQYDGRTLTARLASALDETLKASQSTSQSPTYP